LDLCLPRKALRRYNENDAERIFYRKGSIDSMIGNNVEENFLMKTLCESKIKARIDQVTIGELPVMIFIKQI